MVSLVSILTPCYNTGAIVHRLMDSILMQDYPLVEMYAIDDGSIDNTAEVIKNYIPKFRAKGYQLTYIYQENSGQSVAINNGLKLVNGKFLLWPDSDDYYCDSSFISKMVEKMISGDYAMGRCRIQFVDEVLNPQRLGDVSDVLQKSDQFDNYVFGLNGIQYPPVAFIANMDMLDKVILNREIYTEKLAGQNFQLMLPLSYRQKCFYITDVYAHVLIRKASHSRGFFSGYDNILIKESVYERTLLETINRMPYLTVADCCYYSSKIKLHYIHIRMMVAIAFKKSTEAFAFADQYDKNSTKKLNPVVRMMCRYCESKVLLYILRALRRLFKIDYEPYTRQI